MNATVLNFMKVWQKENPIYPQFEESLHLWPAFKTYCISLSKHHPYGNLWWSKMDKNLNTESGWTAWCDDVATNHKYVWRETVRSNTMGEEEKVDWTGLHKTKNITEECEHLHHETVLKQQSIFSQRLAKIHCNTDCYRSTATAIFLSTDSSIYNYFFFFWQNVKFADQNVLYPFWLSSMYFSKGINKNSIIKWVRLVETYSSNYSKFNDWIFCKKVWEVGTF